METHDRWTFYDAEGYCYCLRILTVPRCLIFEPPYATRMNFDWFSVPCFGSLLRWRRYSEDTYTDRFEV